MGLENKKNETWIVFEEQYPLPLPNEERSIDEINNTKSQIIMEATRLFIKKGYAAVSMRDIAEVIGIKPSSLYNHFNGKEELWEAVLNHAKDLYLLYFKHLDEELNAANTFEEFLEVTFSEPKKMSNVFTCYAFSLVQAEQYYSEYAGEIYNEIFLKYSIEFTKKHFDNCITRGLVPEFDTKAVATVVMHCILSAVNVSVHKLLGRDIPYDYTDALEDLKQFILKSVSTAEKK